MEEGKGLAAPSRGLASHLLSSNATPSGPRAASVPCPTCRPGSATSTSLGLLRRKPPKSCQLWLGREATGAGCALARPATSGRGDRCSRSAAPVCPILGQPWARLLGPRGPPDGTAKPVISEKIRGYLPLPRGRLHRCQPGPTLPFAANLANTSSGLVKAPGASTVAVAIAAARRHANTDFDAGRGGHCNGLN